MMPLCWENILSECSTGPTTRSPRSLFQVAQHLRSSAAHKAITVSAEILPEPGRPVSVDWLTFKDQNNRESTTVEITMSVETLEQFFYAFSDAAGKPLSIAEASACFLQAEALFTLLYNYNVCLHLLGLAQAEDRQAVGEHLAGRGGRAADGRSPRRPPRP